MSARILGGDKESIWNVKIFWAVFSIRKGIMQKQNACTEKCSRQNRIADAKKFFAGDTLQYLAESLLLQGKNSEACDYAEQSVRSCYENWGEGHPRTKESVGVLAKVFAAADRTDEAVSILNSMGLTAEGNALLQ
jgi:hypothetical protein